MDANSGFALQLNSLQRAAAFADIKRPQLILAAAGTGKTSTLAARVAHIVAAGVPPAEILVLAFSRQANQDLKVRLASVVGGSVDKCQIQTFHGWSRGILTKYWRQGGFGRPPTIIAADEESKLKDTLLPACLRWSKLERCRQYACQWLGLAPGSPWSAVLAATEPDLSQRCLQPHLAPVLSSPCSSTLAALDAPALASLSVADKVLVLVDLFFELAKQHDAKLYKLLHMWLPDPVGISAQEVAHCWKSLEQQAVGGCSTPSTQVSLGTIAATASSNSQPSWEQEDERAVFARVCQLFRQELVRMNSVRLADLPLLARDLLAQHLDVLGQVQRRWQYLLVDELQDLCQVQVDLCQLLQDGRGWVTAVGDNNQQIMTFAQAVPDIFNVFSQLFNAQQHKLTINYRCTPAICAVGTAALAGRLVDSNDMQAFRTGSCHPVLVQQHGTIGEEAAAVAAAIKKLVDDGRPAREIAVLYRCLSIHGAMAVHKPLMSALGKLGVPYVVARRGKPAEHPVAQELLLHLQLLVNPDDDVALQKLLGMQRNGVGQEVLSRLQEMQHAARLDSSAPGPSLLACACAFCESAPAAPELRVQPVAASQLSLEIGDHCTGWDALITQPQQFLEGCSRGQAQRADREDIELQRCRACLAQLLQCIMRLRSSLYELPVLELLEMVLEETGLADAEHEGEGEEGAQSAGLEALLREARAFCARWQPPDADAQLSCRPASLQRLAMAALPASFCLGQLVGIAAFSSLAEQVAARSNAGPAPLRDFLTHLVETADEQWPCSKGVLISTIHASKGLEWSTVFMPTVNCGYLPMEFWPSRVDPEYDVEAAQEAHLQEECRLFHVAATRARDLLTITYIQGPTATFHSAHGAVMPMECSPILCQVVSRLRRQPRMLQFEGQLPEDGEGGSGGGFEWGPTHKPVSGGCNGAGRLSKADEIRRALAHSRQSRQQCKVEASGTEGLPQDVQAGCRQNGGATTSGQQALCECNVARHGAAAEHGTTVPKRKAEAHSQQGPSEAPETQGCEVEHVPVSQLAAGRKRLLRGGGTLNRRGACSSPAQPGGLALVLIPPCLCLPVTTCTFMYLSTQQCSAGALQSLYVTLCFSVLAIELPV